MAGYDHTLIDTKWQEYWARENTFATPTDRTKPKYYVLDMFPYPSGDGLHVGHPKGYTATDVVARAKRMMGFNVLRVMGWASFGLPAERRAERTGEHPSVITKRTIATCKSQLQTLGLSYDWSRERATSDPHYYKWTQWIFEVLFDRGLAYQSNVPVNFCPALGTVLPNEEVHDGKYIEPGAGGSITVFTTRPDTLFGGTHVVLAPELALVDQITTPAQRDAVAKYREEVGKRSERDRTVEAADAPKTGVVTGAFAINPVNGKKIPVWVADYVLASYGTGAVFACHAHDERDWAYAKKFSLPIIEVVKGGNVQEAAYTGDGPHVNSEFLDGLNIEQAKTKVIAWLEQSKKGEGTVRYKLRDWLFSRQRYWGEPFPVYFDKSGDATLVPEAELPVELPQIDEYKPPRAGRPPLARAAEWLKYKGGTREPNTLPQWAGSCRSYLRI